MNSEKFLKGYRLTYTEGQIRVEALKELSTSPSGTLTTAELIYQLEARLKPTGKDAEIADGRDDTYFSQKVRNLVSHRESGPGFTRQGLADYDSNTESWTITDKGRAAILN